jgi:Asp-tRNA(Asn)/Glu-tRNA(Gln) amidotransferase A subunit family amidase
MQIIGDSLTEEEILRAGYAFEQAF